MKQSKLKLLSNVFYGIILLFLVFIAGTVALSAFDIPGGIKLYTVQSGSMEPAVKTGSVAIIKPAPEYIVGDVVTFKQDKDRENPRPAETVTHRIHEIKQEDGREIYITKGDANDAPDGSPTDKGLILGKLVTPIPYLGYVVAFAKTQNGFLLMIIVPSTLIIYSELLNVKKEAQRLIEERKKRKLSVKEKIEVMVGEEEIKVEEGLKEIFKKKI